jgi:hypothetical protein
MERAVRSVPEVSVALQGTLDTFALVDVLRLLATTRKVGRLCISGDTGSGSLWLDAGDIVGGELLVPGEQAGTTVEVVFQLMRFEHGSFVFDVGAVPPAAAEACDVEHVLAEAGVMLAERRALEAVVPSLDVRLSLVPVLRGREVVIDAGRWCVIVAAGSGATVREVGHRTGLDDLAVMHAVKDLAELGLVEIGVGAPWAAGTVATFGVTPEAGSAPSQYGDAPADEPHASPADPLGLGYDRPSFAYPGGSVTPAAGMPFAATGLMDLSGPGSGLPYPPEPVLEDASEIARRLANLSPRAAKAVAAAVKATTEEEREAALAMMEAEDGTVDRGLLLRFLGAVDG